MSERTRGRFPKGVSGNPKGGSALVRSRTGPKSELERGRPPGEPPRSVILWDLKQNARSLCPKALKRAEALMDHEDGRIAMAAIELILAYGYGKPEQHVAIESEHRFVVAPAVLPIDEWMATRGQGNAGSAWLQAQQAREGAGRGGAFQRAGAGPAGRVSPAVRP